MPRPKKESQPPAKKRLTLAQLAAYDDMLTDALVDHVYYWTSIPKNRSTYHPSRGIREEDIAKIIQEELVLNKDIEQAEQRLLGTGGICRFVSALKTEKEKDDFRKHLRRYAQIYLPDCPFEVNTTNRYTIVSHEAAVTARRFIRRNEPVKYLSGIQVTITPEEEKDMMTRKKDFSIVVSSRNKTTNLFMGPARFANHDCDANAKLVTTGHAGIEIIATKNIEAGDEITVTYGENYFGEGNCECLCQTCEDHRRNGWEPEDGQAETTEVQDTVEDKPDTYSLRLRRRGDSMGGSSRNSSVTPAARPRILKTKRKSRLSFRDSSNAESPVPEATPHGRKRTSDALATPPVTPAKKMRHAPEASPANERALSRSSSSPSRCASASTTGEAVETDVTTPNQDSPEPRFFTPKQKPMAIESILNTPTPEEEPTLAISIEHVEEETIVQEDKVQKVRKKYEKRVFIKQTTPPARQRTPGDYVLTPLLLSEPEMAWIQCSNCPTYFVQQNAYFTRFSCPRCERHSKIYGYIWPKTDKAGPNDKEERVLDHRTIHRFLHTNDERKIRGRKPLWESEEEQSEEEEEAEQPKRGRRAKREETVKSKKTVTKTVTKVPTSRARAPSTARGQKARQAVEESPEAEEDTTGLRRSGRPRRVSSRLL
ncbi:histone-lysine N-methyltransferase SET9 [Emericellopsis atlantica]|uniref:Histone-lysine N-methyltransferase SET9 n=1 Tax=Emericellopsis atlantica TaxID=2614577 RepID=A0A9P7ZVJ7_9HYPO|nr:histone-lysine N-methyltransferase SET9 [Emericellopsis atlantica]KAG9259118.1 histone-lysine N-methyltransferase SET9 [Emericellopsis atlantica]